MADPFADLPDWQPQSGAKAAPPASVGPDGRTTIYVTPLPKSELSDLPDWSPNSAATEAKKTPRLGTQFGAGINDTIAGTLGFPVDAATWAINKGIEGVNAASGSAVPEIQSPVGGSESIKSAMGLVGADPRQVPTYSTTDQIVRAGGQGVGGMIAPEALISSLAKVGIVGDKALQVLQSVFGGSKGIGDVAKNAIAGAAGGATGETAANLAPEPLKPLARTTGNLVGGGAAVLAADAPRAIPEAIRGVRDFSAPMSLEGQQAVAGGKLRDAAENPQAVQQTLNAGVPELVPGSKPTTFQATGDMGLGALEREVATRNPADFQQRRADQNAARVQALSGIQSTGSPAEVANTLRSSLRDIDDTTQAAIERATQDAQGAAQRVGGQGRPEEYGATLRGALQDAETAARGRERALWKAVDPDGTLTVGTAPIREAVNGVYGNLTAAAQAGLTPAERSLQGVAAAYGETVPFREIADLRSAISSAMREELRANGRSPAYARLSQLRGAVEDSLSGVLQQRVGEEAQAVARGELSPEQTIAARIIADRDAWYERQAAAGGSVAQSAVGNAGSRSATVSPAPRGQVPQGGRPSNDAGNQGVQGNGETPTFDQSAQERLSAANAATRERVQTYNKGPVGQVLRSDGMQGQYRVPNSAVGGTIFKPGPGGFEAVQAFRRATGDQQALATLQDYVASRLRQVASNPDGTLNPAKVTNWLRAHSEAMRAFPDLANRIHDAASAQLAIEDVAAIRKEAMDTYQRGTLGKLIGADNDADVTKIVGGVFSGANPVQSMRQLATEARKNPAAMEGLRKAVVDYLYGRVVGNTEAATSGTGTMKSDTFQTFVRQNRAALRQVFSEEEVNTLGAIGADLQRANRSLNAVRIPGQSNTAQDVVHELDKHTQGHGSLLNQIILAGAAGYELHGAHGALTGILGVLGKNALGGMREAGMQRVDELVKQAMLDPELARVLLAKAPAKVEKSAAGISLAQRLRRLSVFATANQAAN